MAPMVFLIHLESYTFNKILFFNTCWFWAQGAGLAGPSPGLPGWGSCPLLPHVGISRDNWHKSRKAGDKRKPYHRKWKYELERPAANTKIGPRRIHTVHVQGGATRSTGLWGWMWGTSPGARSVVHARQGSLMLSTMQPTTNRSVPRPWWRIASCSLTAHRTDSGTSPTMHCPWATRRGSSWLLRRKRF